MIIEARPLHTADFSKVINVEFPDRSIIEVVTAIVTSKAVTSINNRNNISLSYSTLSNDA